MKLVAPSPFDYTRPSSKDGIVERLGADSDAAVLAGGTDLVTMRADGSVEPSSIVDIKAVAELRFVERTEEMIRIGATTTMAELARLDDPELTALIDGAAVVGSVQTRNRATVGGNVCRSSPAGDTLPGLLVLDAAALIDGPTGSRQVSLTDFFTGPGSNALQNGELLTAIEVPRRGGGSAYQRLTYRAWMDLAVMGVAVRLELDGEQCSEAVVALGGVAPTPILVPAAAEALVGTSLGDPELATAAEAAVGASAPIDDVRGSREYRLQGVRALLPRVVGIARERARRVSRTG